MTEAYSEETNCDVLIVGAGMTGGLLARQLSVEQPDLSLVVIDKKTVFDWHVGESTVEVFDDYAVRNCKLGPYLAANHIVKHGLRFWFDSAEKNLRMCELSEQGRSRYSTLNRGVQLDRARFDRDLCEINLNAGVDVRLGVKVLRQCNEGEPGIVINEEAGLHTVHTSEGIIKCRHLVDAGGRAAPLVRQLGLDAGGGRNNTGSYWARYRQTRCIDELGDNSWRARVENTARWASTNHFMYSGYWLWLIPIDADTVSIGVTFDKTLHPLKIRNAEELTQFLRSHTCMSELLGESPEPLDFKGLSNIGRYSTQHFSENRWYLTGMSGMFVDPLFSGSSAILALSNRMISAMIEADFKGDTDSFFNRQRHFDIAIRRTYKRQCDSFDKYGMFGSFDAFVNWQTLRYHSILNYDVPAQHVDHGPMIASVDTHSSSCGCDVDQWTESQKIGIASDALAKEFTDFLIERDQYYSRNERHFHEKTERASTRRKTVSPEFGDAEYRESQLNWECFVRYYVQRMCEIEGLPFDDSGFRDIFKCDWESGQTLKHILDALKARHEAGGIVNKNEICWDMKGPIDAQLARESSWWCRFSGPDGKPVPEHRELYDS